MRMPTIQELIDSTNYYLEHEVIHDGGCLVETRSHYYQIFKESAEEDYNRINQVLFNFRSLYKSVKNVKNKQISGTSEGKIITGLWEGITIKIYPKESGRAAFDLENSVLTLPCLDIEKTKAFLLKTPNRNENDYKMYLKRVVLNFFETHRKVIVHELMHKFDKLSDTSELKNHRIPDEKATYGTPEYYNSAHEFNAYYNEIVLDVYDMLKNDVVAASKFALFYDYDKKKIDMNSAFRFLLGRIDAVYKPVLSNLNEKYKRKMINRLYKMLYFGVDPNNPNVNLLVTATNTARDFYNREISVDDFE